MASVFLNQVALTAGAKSVLFAMDALLVNTIGYSRVASTTTPWPAAAASLAAAESVVWRNPSSALVRFEVRALIGTAASPDTIDLYLSPLVSPSGGWVAATGSPASNPVTAAAQFLVNDTDCRLSVTADENRVIALVEYTAVNKGCYFGRVAGPIETTTYDPFPVALWAGTWTLAAFKTGWKKIYAADMTTALAAGFLLTLKHPSDAALDPTAAGKGQTTLTSANWHWETPVLAFDESSKRERVGRPDGVFVRENTSGKTNWGTTGEWQEVCGVIFPTSPGVVISASYP